MKFCPSCAAPLAKRVPPGDSLPRYLCDACHQEFTPDEARELRSGIKERLIAQDVAEEA